MAKGSSEGMTVNASPVTAMSLKMRVCVDTHGNGGLAGTLYSQFLQEPFVFQDIVQLIDKMDGIYDSCSFPQAFLSQRTFNIGKPSRRVLQKEGVRYMIQEAMPDVQGSKGTFMVTVQFRQNATWQGTIVWTEKNKKQHFRSALEMLKLMDEALAAESDKEETAGWE